MVFTHIDNYNFFDKSNEIKKREIKIKKLESCIKNINNMKDCTSDIMQEFDFRNSNTPSDIKSIKKDPSSHQLPRARTASSSQLQRAHMIPSSQLPIASTARPTRLRISRRREPTILEIISI